MVGCHYFPPRLQLPPQPLRGCFVNRVTMGVNSLPKTVTRQHCDCDWNPGLSAPESSTLTTKLPSHPAKNVQTDNKILSYAGNDYVSNLKKTTESDETTTTAALTTTVSQQTSAADSSSSTVADGTSTVTDSQTQTSQSHTSA